MQQHRKVVCHERRRFPLGWTCREILRLNTCCCEHTHDLLYSNKRRSPWRLYGFVRLSGRDCTYRRRLYDCRKAARIILLLSSFNYNSAFCCQGSYYVKSRKPRRNHDSDHPNGGWDFEQLFAAFVFDDYASHVAFMHKLFNAIHEVAA